MPSRKSSSRRFPGPEAVEDLGIKSDPLLLDNDYTDAFHKLFEQDSTNTVQAYLALAAAYFSEHNIRDDLSPHDTIRVPNWALQAITIGFMSYRDTINNGGTERFGVAMGMEGSGKGATPRLVKEQRRLRNWKIALEIAKRVEAGANVGDCVRACADEYALGESTVMRVWSKNKDFVRACLERHRLSSPS